MIGRNDVIWKGFYMGRRNRKKEVLERLNSTTLDAKFLHEIQYGLNCSPFEAEAVLDVAKEAYLPFQDEQSIKAPPGKITLIAVNADEPAGKPVATCEKQDVCLTVHRGKQDDRILHEQVPAAFRQARIPDTCQEALSQGALLTREDLAYRIFFVSPRTIVKGGGKVQCLAGHRQRPRVPLFRARDCHRCEMWRYVRSDASSGSRRLCRCDCSSGPIQPVPANG
jgi:hypothetical protein